MNFKKTYEKVKWIVWKCEKEFYIHLWDHIREDTVRMLLTVRLQKNQAPEREQVSKPDAHH